ncbi:MAG TPA: serine/threonine-protein kinase [Polyangiaceae bacterium]|nr:serine/threonine-protein kinase [Polyangiaceae bacterium]
MPLQLGQIIDGKYKIVRLIGEGGMGAVYEGENTRIRRKVAIKLLHGAIAENQEMVARFEREAQVAGTVGNDHILEILDLGSLPNGDRYMVMEFLDGETLTDRIKARVRLQPKDAVALVKQVLTGLSAAHGAGIVHRDLKPDNIFILRAKAGVRDFVKIIDFGISKFSEQGASSRMTRTGALMGTPHYMAPEQATGSADIDRRTDIYAVGIILYEAVTGRVPFQAETFNQLLFEIALAKIIPARQLVPELDSAIDSIIMKASARDPGHRFQTCEEFIAALEEWEKSGRSVSLPPEQSIEAIVAATVPRAANVPSDATLAQPLGDSGARIPSGSVPGVPSGSVAGRAVSTGSMASSPGISAPAGSVQPTLNSWANASQAGLPPQQPPVLAATVIGFLLLVGGGVGAYFVLRPSPTVAVAASAAVPSAAAPVAAAPSLPVVQPATATSETSEPASPSAAEPPAAPAPAAPAPKAVVTPTPKPAAHPVAVRPPPVQEKSDKPKKKSINFGY